MKKTFILLQRKVVVTLLCFFIAGLFSACNDQIINPVNSGSNNMLCFSKLNNGRGQIFTCKIDGSNVKNISGDYPETDEYALWSPDGKYIVFERTAPINGPYVYTYNVKTGEYANLTSDTIMSITMPRWTPDNRVYFSYRKQKSNETGTLLINPDGTNIKKILSLDTEKLFFYKDCYNFIYVYDRNIYKTNIDNSFCEFIRNLDSPYSIIRDFNPNTGELLIVNGGNSANLLATFNITTKETKSVLSGENGFSFGTCNYSNDYTKIALHEGNYEDFYLCILEKSIKTRLVLIHMNQTNTLDYFGWAPFCFSPDGKYIVYTKVCFDKAVNALSKINASYSEYLYIVNTETKKIDSLGMAWNPCFNPNP